MDNNRYCVIMCGGVGSRFWPYSRSSMPKQFLDFMGTGKSLLQHTVERLHGIIPDENIVIMTNESYSRIIAEQLPQLKPCQILLEPSRRNTAPCNAWAAWHIHSLNPNATIMVASSDHLILNEVEFRASIVRAFDFVEKHSDVLLTMGVKPSRPETGYGYIQVESDIDANFSRVKTFTEKPDMELARVFVDSGEFYWNSGIFFWSAAGIKENIRTLAPEIAEIMDRGEGNYGTVDEQAFINENYSYCPNISIDFAIMEKAPQVCVERVDFGWSDLGTWGALYDVSAKSADNNVVHGCKALTFDSSNNIIAVNGDKLVVVSGLDNYVIADTPDALLIMPKDREDRLRTYVNEIQSLYGDKYL